MPLTPEEVDKYAGPMWQAMEKDILAESVVMQHFRPKWEAEWRALPWHKRARIILSRKLSPYIPHVHFYLGEHPRDDEDW